MLVLSRKKGESIRISDDIQLMVLEIRGDKVRLGFEAPREVSIMRDNAKRPIVGTMETIPTAALHPDYRKLMQAK